MRSRPFLSSILAAIALAGSLSQAQIDPSSALLLNSGRQTPVREGGIDSGRYTVRPSRSEAPRREERTSPKKQSAETPESIAVIEPTTPIVAPHATPQPASQPVAIHEKAPEPAVIVVDQRRTTMLELSIAPGYLYTESNSDFKNRDYSFHAPTVAVEASVWLAPSFGLQSGYVSTSNASVSDSLDHSRNVAVVDQRFWAGVRARRFFGTSNLAPILIFGFDYREHQFRAPSDSQLRAKLTSTGPSLLLEAEIPSSSQKSWTLGTTYSPKLKHRETSNDVDFSSGNSPKANQISFSLGSRYRFDRSHSIHWKLTHMVERDAFSGDTSVPDLVTGQNMNGVSVTNSTTVFHLGYTWSD